MRVLHVITSLQTGGAEKMLLRLVAAHSDAKIQSSILVLTSNGPLSAAAEELGITVHALGIESLITAPLKVREAVTFAKSQSPDVVSGWLTHGIFFSLVLKCFLPSSTGLVWNIRSSFRSLKDFPFFSRLLIRLSATFSRCADGIIFNSRQGLRDYVKAGFDMRASNVHVIPNGVESEYSFPTANERATHRLALGVTHGGPIIGHVARYHPMKNHNMLLDVAKFLGSRYESSSIICCGRGVTSGNEELKRILLNSPANVQFILSGEVSQMDDYYRGLDLLILTSSWGEGFPNCLAEALSNGILCVSTDVGDSRDIVGEFGEVVPCDCPEKMCAAIQQTLDLSPEIRVQKGIQAIEAIRERYSIESISESFSTILTNATTRRLQ